MLVSGAMFQVGKGQPQYLSCGQMLGVAMPQWPCENLAGPVSQGGQAELGRVWFPGPLPPCLCQPSGTAPNFHSNWARFGLTLLNWQQQKKCASINLMRQGCQ